MGAPPRRPFRAPPCGTGEGRWPKARLVKTDEEWKRILTPEQYRVMRGKGTEMACEGAFWTQKEPGTYDCAACGAPLFTSSEKFESKSGWPSYWAPVSKDAVETSDDLSHGMVRTEVHCARCGGHLGHVFPDGPKPTGLRYCINSVALRFSPEKKAPTAK
jgi:peptide-methionine (R)-S-oxide reductase